MGNIVLLDELTINQIAAGEVIERPASVVKEMIENSIDAGANNITVEIKNGGISYIRITDNGKGISPDDLEIAFERHATSKIRNASDLNTVISMGFRGEALASIASISNIEMTTKTKEQDVGYKIVVEAGNVLEKQEIGCQIGTSIVVKNLFFNTPVRYKFLKKDYTESGYIEDVITRIALVNPNVAIKLINTGKTIIQTNGNGDLKSVVYSIYGKDISNGIMEVSYIYDDITINGFVGKPEIARSNRSNQLFFVNKRYVKDKTLTAATEQVYKGLIPIGKFGFVVLNVTMTPSKVDVNVHPAKLEVRFEEEKKVFQSIYHSIKDTLLKSDLIASADKKEKNITERSANFEERLKNLRESKKETIADGGLFSFRKQNEKQIENYTEEESKIKTNAVVSESDKNEINNKIEDKEVKDIKSHEIGKPIDTYDVLMQLRKMKENIEKELQEKNITPNTIKEKDANYKLNLEIKEDDEKTEQLEPEKEQKMLEEKEELDDKIVDENETYNIEQEENNKEINEININQEEIINKEDIPDTIKIIEKIQDEEIKKEFEEIKQKIEDLNENPQIISEDFNEMYAKLFGKQPILTEKESQEKEEQKVNAIDIMKQNISVFEQIEEVAKTKYKFVGIVFKTYIILEIDKEMYILDQHAAHERILYEKVKKNYYSDKNKDSQMLLLPDIITLTHKEMDIAKENISIFEQAGFSLEEFGENTMKLTGVPTVCIDLDTKELFLETLDQINTVARTAKQEKEEKFIATVACKAAIKANMALTEQEVDHLMDELLKLPNPFTCPHGRPIVVRMSLYDVERKFARV